MKVLVTGGAGYIGSNIAAQLLKKNNIVIIIDNLVQGHREAVPDEAVFIEGDIQDYNLLKKILSDHKIDAVIHMAGETLVEKSMTDPRGYFNKNVINGLTLLDAMLDCDVDKIIFSSTAAVFGEPLETPITEDHPEKPINAYGESKLMFEKILGWYHRAYGVKYISLRYFNAAGASEKFGEDHDPESHLIPLVMKTALRQKEHIEVFGDDYPTKDGSCIRDYIHVEDLAEAHIQALEAIEKLEKGSYNLGSGYGNSVFEVIETARRITGEKIPSVTSKKRIGDPVVLVASPEKAMRELNWKPKYQDLEIIIESAWNWHKNHPEGYKE